MPVEHYKNLSLENITEEIDGILYIEERKSILGYEGLYEVSTFGRIKALPKQWAGGNKNTVTRKTKIIKPRLDQGYPRISLCKKQKYKRFQVHRLVGIAFIENPDNKPHINHKWGVKYDGRYKMLEWATISENELHSYRVLGKKPSTTWKKNFDHNGLPVVCLNTGEKFSSISEAATKMNLHRRCINRVCAGERPHHKGFNFKYI